MKLAVTALLLGLSITTLQAGRQTVAPDGKTDKNPIALSPFEKGNHELQLGISYNFAVNSDTPERPDIQDADLHLRYGWMLTSPAGSGCFRGNWEFLAEVFGAGVTSGPGDVIAGGTAILRYNFVHEESKWVPYFQIGAGGVYNNIYQERPQRLIGQAFEFNLQGAFGLRYLINPHTACYVEAGYRHLSNAGLADRNNGLNSIAIQTGVSWLW